MDRLELMADGALSIKEATESAGVSRAFLYETMKRGELPYCKIGRGKGKRVIPRRALAQWLADNLIASERGKTSCDQS